MALDAFALQKLVRFLKDADRQASVGTVRRVGRPRMSPDVIASRTRAGFINQTSFKYERLLDT